MRGLRVVMALLVGGAVVSAGGARGQEGSGISPGCAKVVAVLDEGGGGLSAEEVAKKTNTDVETVRSCTDAWRATKHPAGVPGASGGTQPVAPGCAKIVAVLEEGGGGLSAEEIAKKTSTDVETVRGCTDAWRATTKGTQR